MTVILFVVAVMFKRDKLYLILTPATEHCRWHSWYRNLWSREKSWGSRLLL